MCSVQEPGSAIPKKEGIDSPYLLEVRPTATAIARFAKGEVDMFRTKLRVSFKYELGWSRESQPV